jgi:hypothetical protein
MKMIRRRTTSPLELDDVVDYWRSLPRGSGYHVKRSLTRFLGVFTPAQIKGAMCLAHTAPRRNYFKYLCGILCDWCRDVGEGKEPLDFPA